MISAWISKNRFDERLLLEAEPVPVGFLAECLENPLLPIDQGPVAVGGHPVDVLELWQRHEPRGLCQAPNLRPRPARPEPGSRLRIGCRAAEMDLLEYQGKQLFAEHGVPVPEGRHADTVPAAVEAAEELGYPCVIKAQVRIGKRGKAGGIKIANDREEARKSRRGDPRHGHPRLHGPRGVGRAGVEDRRRVLRVDHPRPLGEEAPGDPLAHGRDGRRGGRRDRSRRRWSGATSSPARSSPSSRPDRWRSTPASTRT